MKIIRYNNEPTINTSNLQGSYKLYAEDSTRIVSKYLIFNKTLNGETKRGHQIIIQQAEIRGLSGDLGAVLYNYWHDIKLADLRKIPVGK